MSYGLRVATSTTGLPVSIRPLTRSRWACEPEAFAVATTTTSLAAARSFAAAIVAASGAVPVSNRPARNALARCSAGAALAVSETLR